MILGGGLWNLYGAGIFFQKFLNKLMQRERDFGRQKCFSKISHLESQPLESQLDSSINAGFAAPSLIEQADVTHPPEQKGIVP